MSNLSSMLSVYGVRLGTIGVIIALYFLSLPPSLSSTERAALASQFAFTRFTLPEVSGHPVRFYRDVNPSLQHITSWISSVGAGVAINDLDSDGLANDLCYVETRTNKVIVAPAPGTPSRYVPFVIDADPLPFDATTMAPMGCLPGDMNEDGRMDLLVYYWGRTPIAFLHSAAHSGAPTVLNSASYTRYDILPSGERWFTNAATFADLDGDGHGDLIIGNYFADGARILDAQANSHEQMQSSMSHASNGGHTHFLRWNGATTGSSPTVQFELVPHVLDEATSRGWTLALGAADLDGDLLPEVYIANDFGPDHLLHNQSQPGQIRFNLLKGQHHAMTPKSKVLGYDSFKGMGVDFGDLNGDGMLDIIVGNITTNYGLHESNLVFMSTGEPIRAGSTIAPYVERSDALGLARSGWSWDTRFADLNNDGVLEVIQATGFVKGTINRWPELHELAMGNDALLADPRSWMRVLPGDDIAGHQHNPFFVKDSRGRYHDLASDLGLNIPYVTRGIATADVDGDGRLDFALANQWEPSTFYRNASPNPGAFLGLRLLLPVGDTAAAPTRISAGHTVEGAGRPALGATATVILPDGRRLVAQVDGGNGHSGKRSPELFFGLGQLAADTPLQVELRWRDTQGQVRQEIHTLTSGWHTVMLGSSAERN